MQNFQDNNINQIDCVYNLEFLVEYKEMLDITIKKNGTSINIQNCMTDEVILGTSSQQIDEYEIEVIYKLDEVQEIRKKLINEEKTEKEIDELIYGLEIKINIKQFTQIN